VLGDVEVKKWN